MNLREAIRAQKAQARAARLKQTSREAIPRTGAQTLIDKPQCTIPKSPK